MNNFFSEGNMFLGINYWSSASAINMWDNWDESGIDHDFKKLAGSGIEVLRIFLLWPVFQPLKAIRDNFGICEYRFGEQPLPDTEAGMAGVSDAACKKLESLCSLAEKYSLKLIVALFTGHMSGRYYAPPAFEGKNLLSDPTVIKWEIRFAKYIVKRFNRQPSIIAWDLGNECNGFSDNAMHADTAYVWTWSIANAIRSSDRNRPILSGFDKIPVSCGAFNIRDIGEIVDINTVHPYNIFHTALDPLISMRSILDGIFYCRLYSDLSGKPSFIEEVGSIGYMSCSEKTESAFYRALLFSVWVHNCNGIMWWCAFDQGELTYAPYDLNNIGSDYGFFRFDGSKKPIAEENERFRTFLQSFPSAAMPEHIKDAVCIIGKNTENADMLRTSYCLAKQANMDLEFTHAADKLPEADLYIMPSIDDNQAISRYRLLEILERVKNGASFYLSVGTGLFRMIPKITGVTFAYRKKNAGEEKVYIGGQELRLKADYIYTLEHYKAEALASADNGRPVYFKYRYGKGFIYFSTIPVEKYLAERINPFTDEAPDYSVWYSVLKSEIPDKKVLNITAKTIRATEHIINKTNRYAVLINYSDKVSNAVLSLKKDWKISDVLYGKVHKLSASIGACDAAVIKLSKETNIHDL